MTSMTFSDASSCAEFINQFAVNGTNMTMILLSAGNYIFPKEQRFCGKVMAAVEPNTKCLVVAMNTEQQQYRYQTAAGYMFPIAYATWDQDVKEVRLYVTFEHSQEGFLDESPTLIWQGKPRVKEDKCVAILKCL